MNRSRTRRGLTAVILVGCLTATGARPVGEDQVELTREALEQWVELRRVISREKRDQAERRELLTDRIELVRREIETRRARIAEAQSSIGKADEELAKLVDENERLKSASVSLEDVADRVEARTKELLVQLPEPVSEHVKPLALRLPDEAKGTKLSLSERFQNVVGILNEVNKFNREMTVTSELRTLAGGSAAEVTALYVGIGQGYYVTANQDAAGAGSAGPEGWTWRPTDESASEIAAAIAIVKGEEPARFVSLPIRVE